MPRRLVQLYRDFPHFRQADIKRLFSSSGGSFYAPAYLALEQATMQTEDERGFPLRKGGAGGSKIDKGKAKACDEFEKEHTWVVSELRTCGGSLWTCVDGYRSGD